MSPTVLFPSILVTINSSNSSSIWLMGALRTSRRRRLMGAFISTFFQLKAPQGWKLWNQQPIGAAQCTNVYSTICDINPQSSKHPFSGEKVVDLRVKAYLSPDTTAFMKAGRARICSIYFPLETLCVSSDKGNGHFSLCISTHACFSFLVVLRVKIRLC